MKWLKRLILAAMLLPAAAQATPPALFKWEAFDQAVFDRAKAGKRLILLELEAVWCHWCHVMDDKTWSDPRVAEALRRDFIAVRVDHDARPDLAERYRDYGWPAIIILDGNGQDLAKRAGYIPAERLLKLMAATLKDPRPEQTAAAEPAVWAASPLLAPDTAAELQRRFLASHDAVQGGLLGYQKVVDRDATEYALLLAVRGDKAAEAMARGDLQGARRLSDPVWGGIYQYSTDGDWDHPHYEKLGFIQADYLRMFALGYGAFQDPADLQAIRQIHGFLRAFLRAPDGSFYASQDADLQPGQHAGDYFALPDGARRRLGVPRVDKHVYARENGLIANALAQAYLATGEKVYLEDARLAVSRMLELRSLPDGGFRHDAGDQGGAYLADNLAMLRAMLALHGASGERDWLLRAMATADYIDRHFRRKDQPGYVSAVTRGPLAPVVTLDENLALARAANLLFHYSGKAELRDMAERAMRYIVTPEVALARVSDPGILVAARELGNDPAHLTVVGAKNDDTARALFLAASRWPVVFKRVEWWDRQEGPLSNPDVAYPALARSAAYVCTDGRCSRPLFSPRDLLSLATALHEQH